MARPDFDDSLRRAAVVVYQHIIKGEKARASGKRAPFDPRVVYSRQKSTGYASSFRTSSSSLAPSSAGASTVAGDEDDEDEPDMTDTFHDSLFIKPQWQYSYVRTPRMGFGTVYKLEVMCGGGRGSAVQTCHLHRCVLRVLCVQIHSE